MNHQPDKIFKDKLASHEYPAPLPAWERINSSLDRKSHGQLWLRVAAAILVLSVVTAVFMVNREKPAEVITKVRPLPDAKKQSPPKHTPSVAQTPPIAPGEDSNRLAETKRPARNKRRTNESVQTKETPASEQNADELPLPVIDPAEDESIAVIVPEVVAPSNASPTVTEGTTVVFSANEVNEKYLNKIDEEEATSDEKKSSTLKRLLNKARDLKHSDPLGEIRQKKDEILALDFKKDKQRNQNR